MKHKPLSVGERYGRLTVLCKVPKADVPGQEKSHASWWRCRCDCNTLTLVRGDSLRTGNTKSCGCLFQDVAQTWAEDLKGRRFGRLAVIERAPNRGMEVRWRCLCDCGNFTIVSVGKLRKGSTTSCGCFAAELSSKRYTKDLLGKRFERLLVTKRAGSDEDWRALWECLCDCGNILIAKGHFLLNGDTKSCGCLIHRRGEENPRWLGNASVKVQIRNSPEYKAWRHRIFQRDDYVCQFCAVRGVPLHVDRIKPFSEIMEENEIVSVRDALACPILWDINNGRTLCAPCHRGTDTYAGRQNRRK